jgi:hypothetical protein
VEFGKTGHPLFSSCSVPYPVLILGTFGFDRTVYCDSKKEENGDKN